MESAPGAALARRCAALALHVLEGASRAQLRCACLELLRACRMKGGLSEEEEVERAAAVATAASVEADADLAVAAQRLMEALR